MIIKTLSILLTTLFFYSACNKAQQLPIPENKILIVYLSRTSNTKFLADIIHQAVGGKLVALELENPYPKDYLENVEQVAKENEEGFLPVLKTKVADIEKYDTVFIGFPTWGMQLPPPVKSFLKQYDLSGKTVIPFNTNAGYGIGNSFDTVKKLCPNSNVMKGFSTTGGKEKEGVYFVMEGEKKEQVEKEIKEWLEKIDMIKRER